ncbi:carbohydrate/starch-binding module (family 21) domain-containing protein [Trichoderma breve]|uniref:Carbohydrate/starch-binding module (Family 21) domain-containing protein n=1 Tax=Trichoderma breve TaxID=2034170 RepID=A0A9W9BJW6_9HYPO|nr:carbohydrate/starch-binding module (family 21) domain-containing protein [Trichoderma breve]KAJ4861208.1 carbohydrate/starch-binding module (family 21) domain-containing protein [Trichoderma breve]
MPYTPPSHRSPASSATASPDVSRRSSITSGQKPSLPRSASYLSKNRRTPSAPPAVESHSTPSPPYGSSDEVKNAGTPPVSASLRKSPPPVTDDRGIPNAAIISPPDSASSDSEDDSRPEIRGRKLGKLRDAVSQIPQPRTPSPPSKDSRLSPGDVTPRSIVHTSFSAMSLSDLPKSGRRGHVRSATDPNVSAIMTSAENSQTVSEDSEDDLRPKPPMVRKKSGELVRPALRGHKRPSSMPGTPVFAKAVHFDSHLEHIRHFLQVDRPLAVSAGSSPVENYDSDAEYPFPGGEKRTVARTPPFDWQLITNNFPHDSPSRRDQPVRLEKVWLSPDQKSMLGSVVVANMSYQKLVVCRFTLDYWKTTSEVVAEFSHEIRPKVTRDGQDRFQFSIKLSDTANLEMKTLYFCIRYNVNGQEYWDSNSSANFQVDFRKQFKPQNGKNGFQGAQSRSSNNSLPRSNRKQTPTAPGRQVQMPLSFDDFDKKPKFKFDDHINDFLGEHNTPGLRLKTNGLAFANRYDFGASLSAAVQAAKDSASKDKDALYMKRNVRDSPTPMSMSFGPPLSAPSASQSSQPVAAPAAAAAAAAAASAPSSPPVGLGLGLASSSYEELVSKYCFFGSKTSTTTAATNGTTKSEEIEGISPTTVSVATMAHPLHHTGPAAHHSLHHPIEMKLTRPLTADYLAASPSSPLDSISSVLISRDQSSTPKSMPHMRSPSPSFSTSPTDAPFFAQQMIQQRFRWGAEPHTATAIRG